MCAPAFLFVGVARACATRVWPRPVDGIEIAAVCACVCSRETERVPIQGDLWIALRLEGRRLRSGVLRAVSIKRGRGEGSCYTGLGASEQGVWRIVNRGLALKHLVLYSNRICLVHVE